jgi:hypothetical protein
LGYKMEDEKHPGHVTRYSDASSYDEVCILCGARDIAGGGWGTLIFECKGLRDHGSVPDAQMGRNR